METTVACCGYMGRIDSKLEDAIVCWGYLRAAAAAADPAKGRLQHRGKLRGPPGSTVTH